MLKKLSSGGLEGQPPTQAPVAEEAEELLPAIGAGAQTNN
jgi:hypothetical protein